MSNATEEELKRVRESMIPPTIMNDIKGEPEWILPMWVRFRDREHFEELLKAYREEMEKRYSQPKMRERESWEVPSSKGKTTYIVEFDGFEWSCTCTGFKYRKTCRHIVEKKKTRSQM